jgi:manganese/zinc/iron transport system permease protein
VTPLSGVAVLLAARWQSLPLPFPTRAACESAADFFRCGSPYPAAADVFHSLLAAAIFEGAAGLTYNTLVVVVGVATVGFAAGVVGCLALLRKRPLVGDAAAHATLAGVAAAFLLTGRRDLPMLLAGALAAAVAALATLVIIRRVARTRDDAATAVVIGVSFGIGLALVSGITARGLPGGGGLEQFLLGHTAALTASDAILLAVVSVFAVVIVGVGLKEAVVLTFDAEFAAATGWPVGWLDLVLVGIVAVMVVVGLPAAGAVLVTALVVIPPVAARQWTDRVPTMLGLAGLIGLASAVIGVAVTAARPGLSTGPVIVLAAAVICGVSFLLAPRRGWIAARSMATSQAQRWMRGLVLEECLRAAGPEGERAFDQRVVVAAAGGDSPATRRQARRGWQKLAADGVVVLTEAVSMGAEGSQTPTERMAPAELRWKLSVGGLALAQERRRRIAAWNRVLDDGLEDGRDSLTLDLPDPSEAGFAGSSAAEHVPGDTSADPSRAWPFRPGEGDGD